MAKGEAAGAAVKDDVLSDLLGELRFRSGVFARVELTPPWGIEVPAMGKAMFHFVPRGTCLLEVEGMPAPMPLGEADIVILPHGDVHFMRDSLGRPTKRIDHLLRDHPLGDDRTLRLGAARAEHDETGTSLVCGGYWFEEKGTLSVLQALPPVLHLRARSSGFEWLRLSQELIARELTSGRAGGAVIAARIADAIFIEAARRYFAEHHGESDGGELVGMHGMRDPAVALAVALMNRDPQRRWTVEGLARSVALSRATFAERFRTLVGESPMKYLARHRMVRAMRLLRASRATVGEIAQAVGYESDAAFCRAFTRQAGLTPAAFRKRSSARRS